MKKRCLIFLACIQTGLVGLVWAVESKPTPFQEAYSNWTVYLANLPLDVLVKSSISSDVYYDNEPFRRIVDLGVSAVPEIIKTVDGDRRLVEALQEITKWKYDVVRTGDTPKAYIWTVAEIPSIRGTNGPPNRVEVWKYWWQEERFKTGEHFDDLYSEWNTATKAGESGKAEQARQQIIDLGLPVLPYLVDAAKTQPEWMPAVRELTHDSLPQGLSGAECATWWQENQERFSFPGKGGI